VSHAALLPDVFTALAEDDLRPVRAWLRRTLVEETGRLSGGDFDELARLAQWNAEEPGDTRAIVGRVVAAAADLPLAVPLLALYLRYECELAWEVSWHHEPIREVIAAAGDAWARVAAERPNVADPELSPVALAHLRIVDHELTVETAASCASLSRWASQSRRTAAFAASVAAAATRVRAGVPGDDPRAELADLLARTAHLEAMYYDAVALAAQAVHGHFTGAPTDVAAAIQVLHEVEDREDLDDIDRSELRAHRYNLEALRDGAQRPWLTVEYGKIVYLYPFGLRGLAPTQAVQALRDSGAHWTLAGLPVTRVATELLLNDIWKGDDPLQRQYRGAAVHLPDLEVPDPDRDEPYRLQVELRLSELGNHYLRMSCPLEDAAPHHAYAAMLRAAPEFGDLTELGVAVRPADSEEGDGALEWGQLAELADEIIKDVGGQLRTHTAASVAVSCRPGMYHVMLTIERATTVSPTGETTRLSDAKDVTSTFGAQPLCHPVRHGISSVGEWLRYPIEDLPLVDAPGFRDDLLLRSGNTTLVVQPGSPNYMIFAVEEAAEFVATLDGLFAGWQDELAEYYSHVRPAIAAMIAQLERRAPAVELPGGPPLPAHEHTTEGLRYTQSWLEQQQLRLHEFVMGSRLTLMFITSPSLVTSPVVRLTLDRLLAAAGFDRLRDEFVGMVEEVLGDRIGTLIDASVRRRQEQREAAARAERERAEAAARAAAERDEHLERMQRRRMDTLLAVIAAVGVSGLAQILQAGYDIREVEAAGLAMFVILVAVAFGAFVHRFSGSRGDGAGQDREVR